MQTAVPDIADIRTVVRPEDKHRYLMIQYSGGLEVPQWMVSDGTLRLLALMFLAYLPAPRGVYLVEEPEVGVHPTAIETVMQSLSSVYEGQVLVTSHSPVVLRRFLKWQHGLVVLDHDGSGHEDEPREVLEKAIEQRLNANGWAGRSKAVIIHPELESWVWDSTTRNRAQKNS